MNVLKRCISIFVVLAFVMTTMPMVSHGSSHQDAKPAAEKSEKTTKKSHPDCHGHDKKPSSSGNDKKPSDQNNKTSCCDTVCKCIGGTCHSAVKIFGNHDISFVHPLTTKNLFAVEQIVIASDLHSRIKRPPKA